MRDETLRDEIQREGHGEARGESLASLFSSTQIQHLMRIEFTRAQRYGYPLGVLVVEIDGLANLRDERGFDARQDVLGAVTHLLQSTTRACDYLGRLVDDRFLAVLPHTGAAGVERTAERLLVGARALTQRGTPLAVHLSVGISVFEEGSTLFFDALVEAAEAGLAAARAAGGDRAVLVRPGQNH